MQVISIGTDRNLFKANSEVRGRQIALAEKLVQVTIIVFTLKTLGLKPFDLSPKVKIIPTNSASRWFYTRDATRIGKRLSRPDLITAQDPFECGWAAWRLARTFNTELELQIHTDFLNPYFRKQSLLNRIRVRLAKFLLPKADRIRVVSRRIQDSLISGLQLPISKIRIEPIKIDLEKIKNAPIKTDLHKKYPQFDKIILMASRLTKEKNIPLAIKAMTGVVKESLGAGLLIVGSGPERDSLVKLVAELDLSNHVIFEDWIDRQKLFSYYKTADLFLLTSLYEGFNTTLREAAAARCRIVSTDVGGARESHAKIVGYSIEAVINGILEEIK